MVAGRLSVCVFVFVWMPSAQLQIGNLLHFYRLYFRQRGLFLHGYRPRVMSMNEKKKKQRPDVGMEMLATDRHLVVWASQTHHTATAIIINSAQNAN